MSKRKKIQKIVGRVIHYLIVLVIVVMILACYAGI